VPGLYPSEEDVAGAAGGVHEAAGSERALLDGLAAQVLSRHDHLSQDERTKLEGLQQRHREYMATKAAAAIAGTGSSATATRLRTDKSTMKLFQRLTPGKKSRPGSAPGEDKRPGEAEALAAAAAADAAAAAEAEAKVEEQLQIGEWMHALRNKMAVKEAQLAHTLGELEGARLRESDLQARLDDALFLLQVRVRVRVRVRVGVRVGPNLTLTLT
jgi:hypothetical protein